MATAQKNTIEAGSVEAAIVAELQRKFGQSIGVWVGDYYGRSPDPPCDFVKWYGLAIRRDANGPWEHKCRRPTLAMLLDCARVCQL